MKRLSLLLLGLAAAVPVGAASIGSWNFNNSLLSDTGGTALTAVDPLSQNAYVNSTIFGQNRTVYHFGGSASPAANQGGLLLNTSGLIESDSYALQVSVQPLG